MSKKELALKENRSEWEADKKVLTAMKESHEKEVEDHAQVLLNYDDLMKKIKSEISAAEQLEKVIAEEFNASIKWTEGNGNHSELLQLQADVVECQAAVDEANEELVAALDAMESLKKEVDDIDRQMPLLEGEKQAAVAKKNYKAAGKASKEIKEATAR